MDQSQEPVGLRQSVENARLSLASVLFLTLPSASSSGLNQELLIGLACAVASGAAKDLQTLGPCDALHA